MIIEVKSAYLKSAYLKAALICQAKKDIRFYLNGIFFMPDGRLAASDGYILFKGFHESKLKSGVIVAVKGNVPAKFSRAIITLPDPVDGDVTIHIGNKEGAIRYVGGIGETVGMGWCELVDGRFPDIDRATLNTERGQQGIAYIQGSLMERAAKIAKLFSSDKGFTPMEIHMPKKDVDGYLVKFSDIDSGYDRVPQILIMPYKG